MLFLKQSTASQSVLIGPFVDSTDGATAETGLTIANTDIRLSANGGNLAAKNSGGGTHDEAGWYTITLDATDTATVGRLQLHCKVAGALMVHHEFQVLEEAVFDSLFGASAAGYQVPIWSSASATVNLSATTIATLNGHTPQTGDSFARLGAPAGASVSADVAAMKVDTAAILADTGTDGVVVASGSKTGYTLTATTGLGNQTADITGSLSGSVGSVTGAVGSVTGLTASDVGAIKTKTDSLTFTVAGNVDANIQRINDVALTGDGSATPFDVA